MSSKSFLTFNEMINNFTILSSLNPKFEKFYTNELSEKEVFDLISIFNPKDDFKRYQIYKEYIEYAGFKNHCENAVSSLQKILKNYNDLENENIKQWIIENEKIFTDDLLLLHVDNDDVDEKNFTLHDINESLEKTEYLFIIKFCEVMSILHHGEYHLPVEKRTVPNENDYHYGKPAEDEPNDFTKVVTILNAANK